MPSLADSIKGVLKERGWEKTIDKYLAVSLWEETVGPTMARHCQAVEIKGNTILVKASTPSWRNEIAFYKDEILRELNQKISATEIKDIRFIS